MDENVLKNIPTTPGVYKHFDAHGKLIYIGKAKNLRVRNRSYFRGEHTNSKTRAHIQEIAHIETISTQTETEALILENELISTHKPKYNIQLRDNRRFAWILITDETYPRIVTARNKKRKGTYFGPYTDGYARRTIIQGLTRAFKLRTCRTLPNKVCLQYHIKNCSGPCEGYESREEYNKKIELCKRILSGDHTQIRRELTEHMHQAAEKLEFEQAKKYRDTINALKDLETKQTIFATRQNDQDIIGEHNGCYVVLHVRRGVVSGKHTFNIKETNHEGFITAYYRMHNPPKEIITQGLTDTHALQEYLSRETTVTITQPQQGEKKRLLELAQTNAQEEAHGIHPGVQALQKHLKMGEPPVTIDCFDISNHQGDTIVAACVRYRNGEPEPTKYRLFNMKTVTKQDDFASMNEAVRRRYKNGDLPDLIVIDGGRGQLQAAQEGLERMHPIISLAKQEEEVFVPGLKRSLNIPQTDQGLLLLRRIRDATHRAVITHHRNKRRKNLTTSTLDSIPGIGPKRKEHLYEKYKTIDAMRKATKKELAKLLGEKQGTIVYEALRE